MSISKLIKPKPEQKRSLIQARVEAELANRLRVKLANDRIELKQFFEAAIKDYLGEK